MFGISLTEEAAAACCRFVKYAVPTWIGRPVGDAVLHHVNVDTWAEGPVKFFSLNPLHNFLDGEICGIGALPVQERGGDPNLISNF
jgi:hypothetical protein